MLKVPNLRLIRHEFQAFGNALVRLLVKVAVMPEFETLRIDPVGDEPNFVETVKWAQDFHADEAGLLIDEVRAIAKGFLNLCDLSVGDDELAERDERIGGLLGA